MFKIGTIATCTLIIFCATNLHAMQRRPAAIRAGDKSYSIFIREIEQHKNAKVKVSHQSLDNGVFLTMEIVDKQDHTELFRSLGIKGTATSGGSSTTSSMIFTDDLMPFLSALKKIEGTTAEHVEKYVESLITSP